MGEHYELFGARQLSSLGRASAGLSLRPSILRWMVLEVRLLRPYSICSSPFRRCRHCDVLKWSEHSHEAVSGLLEIESPATAPFAPAGYAATGSASAGPVEVLTVPGVTEGCLRGRLVFSQCGNVWIHWNRRLRP